MKLRRIHPRGARFAERRLFRSAPGYSLVEVLASLAIFLAGVVSILNFFPNMLVAEEESLLLADATMLAQEKIMEIRRDDFSDPSNVSLIEAIRRRTIPTEPVLFPRQPRLAYSFNGTSVLHPGNDANDPSDDPGVARIIVIKVEQNRPPAAGRLSEWDIMLEMRFDRGT